MVNIITIQSATPEQSRAILRKMDECMQPMRDVAGIDPFGNVGGPEIISLEIVPITQGLWLHDHQGRRWIASVEMDNIVYPAWINGDTSSDLGVLSLVCGENGAPMVRLAEGPLWVSSGPKTIAFCCKEGAELKSAINWKEY